MITKVVIAVSLVGFAAACTGSDGYQDAATTDSGVNAGDVKPEVNPDAGATADAGFSTLCTRSEVTETQAKRNTGGGSVTVDATFVNALEHCRKSELAFKLVLDTHSVDLMAINLAGSARVETSSGQTRTTGFVWKPGSESSHHRDGILTVPAVPLAGAAWLRLTLSSIAGSNRVFEWQADLLAHDLP